MSVFVVILVRHLSIFSNNTEYGHFLRSAILVKISSFEKYDCNLVAVFFQVLSYGKYLFVDVADVVVVVVAAVAKFRWLSEIETHIMESKITKK